jgi:four helix bundle protein
MFHLNRAKMGTVKNFEELEIWQLARELVNVIYSDFRPCKDFTFKNQIAGAGISIMNNISEGFCRNSNAEFRQFLKISSGSAGEVKSMYYIAEDQQYISKASAITTREKCQRIINGNSRLMKYLKTYKNSNNKPTT